NALLTRSLGASASRLCASEKAAQALPCLGRYHHGSVLVQAGEEARASPWSQTTARVHQPARQRGGSMADFGAQQPAMPVIGFLDSRSSDAMGSRLGGFRQGLKELGFAEGENVAVAYPWAEDRLDRLPEMAAELVSRQPTVIAPPGGPTTGLAAKAPPPT